jgi:hypothetical protein
MAVLKFSLTLFKVVQQFPCFPSRHAFDQVVNWLPTERLK